MSKLIEKGSTVIHDVYGEGVVVYLSIALCFAEVEFPHIEKIQTLPIRELKLKDHEDKSN